MRNSAPTKTFCGQAADVCVDHFRGEHIPQDSNDPHASETLAQILPEREKQAAVKIKKKMDLPKKSEKIGGSIAIKTMSIQTNKIPLLFNLIILFTQYVNKI